MGRKLFKAIGVYNLPNYGLVEKVTGEIDDMVFRFDEDFKATCYRCCFYRFRECHKPACLPDCIDGKIKEDFNDITCCFYRRKTAAHIYVKY